MQNLKNTVFMHKKRIFYLMGLTLLLGLAIIVQAFSITYIVDGVFVKNLSFSAIVPWLIALAIVLFIRAVSDYISKRIGVLIASDVKRDVRKNLLNKYAGHPVALAEKGQTGKKVSMLLDGVDEMDSFYSQFIPQVMQSTFVPLLAMIVIFTQHVNSGIILLITAPFIPIFMIVIGLQTQKKSEEKLEKLASFSGTFLDTLQGLVTLKLFGQTKKQKDEIEKSSLGFRDTTMDILKIAFTKYIFLELISMISICFVALVIALQLVLYKNISFFTAFVVLILVPEFFTALKELGTTFHNGRSSMGAAKKVLEEFDEEETTPQWGSYVLEEQDIIPTIHLDHVGYQYPESDFQLQDIDATFQPKQRIAIVGASGAGKSTLLHLLAGMITPEQGVVKINQENLVHFTEASWLNQLSYISQQPYIFSGTIGENIAIGTNQPVDENAIQEAAKLAGIAPLIESLEKQYDTSIGEAGRGLSSGEMQRISIARAFLKNPNVILLDEPTRGLDLATEKILQESIEKLAETATVITVAHRLHTIKTADQILFLDNGQLKAVGTHNSLINSLDAYRKMVTIQQGGKEA
mgnify:CR=1 FL=1